MRTLRWRLGEVYRRRRDNKTTKLVERIDLVSSMDATCLAIFDHDGVLVDSLEFHQQAWLEFGRRTGLNLTPEFIHQTFGMTNRGIFRLLLGDSMSEAEIANYSALKEECYRDVAQGEDHTHGRGAGGARRPDAAGVRLAIGSSGARANLELTVHECGLDGRFAAIASLEDITRGKPDPQIFLVAATKARVEPSRSVVFEDAPVGIQAAKAAGMYAVGITTSHPAGALWDAGADEVVDSLVGYDVQALLDRLQRRAKS